MARYHKLEQRSAMRCDEQVAHPIKLNAAGVENDNGPNRLIDLRSSRRVHIVIDDNIK